MYHNGGMPMKSRLDVGETKRYRTGDVMAKEGDEGCEAYRLVKRLRAAEKDSSDT